ncbi:MAG: methionine--tRNA ligase [Candidatus Moranbacteria bacterium]|nr:methionine--tRNA ligase [Candidatus Moranbacteria bacterium]
MEKDHYYITTTLPYINSRPHIGFAMEIVRADVVARFHSLLGENVFFNTGTDEHGLKVFRKSQEMKIETQMYCDKQVKDFIGLKEVLNLSFNNFIRTTDKQHIKAAQEFWRICRGNGYIYKKKYKSKYCVGCELEKTDSELDDQGFCPLHPGQPLEIIEEENYFFKFSLFREKLLDFYDKNPRFVLPKERFNEIKSFVEKGLEDFSISRLKEKMPWGISVPDDDSQVMYVWFDALVNYVSAIGWPENKEKFNKWWPVTQFCGKDNLRQQAAMWQAMLMAAGLPNSRQVYVNGFIISGGKKMSKSLGNVIDPLEMVAKFGTDGTRYLLLTMGKFGQDADFTWDRMEEKYNADLANGIGNFASRVMKLFEKSKIENIKKPSVNWKKYEKLFNEGKAEELLEEIWNIIRTADKFVEKNRPWELVKSDLEKFNEVMAKLVGDLDLVAELTLPFMPETSNKIKQMIKSRKTENLFRRLT